MLPNDDEIHFNEKLGGKVAVELALLAVSRELSVRKLLVPNV